MLSTIIDSNLLLVHDACLPVIVLYALHMYTLRHERENDDWLLTTQYIRTAQQNKKRQACWQNDWWRTLVFHPRVTVQSSDKLCRYSFFGVELSSPNWKRNNIKTQGSNLPIQVFTIRAYNNYVRGQDEVGRWTKNAYICPHWCG